MKIRSCFYFLVFALSLTAISFASEQEWCPDTIKVVQKAETPPPQWSLSYGSPRHKLEMVTFFSGPPEENASLVYDKRSKIKGGWVGTWNLPRDKSGCWIRCSYEGTRAELSRRLPNTLSVCRVTYDEGSHYMSGLPVIRKIECR